MSEGTITAAAVAVSHVHKSFGHGDDTVNVLGGISLQVHRSESVALLGPSGCGKSTLLSVVGLMMSPDSGTIHLDGIDVATLSRHQIGEFRRERLGFIFQQFNLVNYLSAYDNVELALHYSGLHPSARVDMVDTVLARVGIDHRKSHLPLEISVGERQRVAIARALVKNPAVLLADEPTGSLDRDTGREVLALLDEVRGTTAVVLVTHDQEVAEWADRVVRFGVNGTLET